jgi:hypothetical protein
MGGTQSVLKFAVANGDMPYAGDLDPRADVETAPTFKPGDDDYFAVRVLVPTTMPAVNTDTAWFELAEVYGKPYGGSPPISLNLSDYGENGVNHFMMNQDATNGYARAWTGPAANDGKWHTIIYHVNFETNNTGSVQIYFDGQLGRNRRRLPRHPVLPLPRLLPGHRHHLRSRPPNRHHTRLSRVTAGPKARAPKPPSLPQATPITRAGLNAASSWRR